VSATHCMWIQTRHCPADREWPSWHAGMGYVSLCLFMCSLGVGDVLVRWDKGGKIEKIIFLCYH